MVDDANLLVAEQPPDSTYLCGTDSQGRDILSRVIYGARISLSIGIVTQVINTIIGVILGVTAGFIGKLWDDLVMGLTSLMLSIPSLVFSLAIMAYLGPGLINVFIALGLTNWAFTCRIARAQVLSARSTEYVMAAKAMGYGRMRIMWNRLCHPDRSIPLFPRSWHPAANSQLGRHAFQCQGALFHSPMALYFPGGGHFFHGPGV